MPCPTCHAEPSTSGCSCHPFNYQVYTPIPPVSVRHGVFITMSEVERAFQMWRNREEKALGEWFDNLRS